MGLPAWRYAGWDNRYFDAGSDRLRQYARVFRTVEGNTTFYATPAPTTVANWCAQLRDLDFKCCFKLPRNVTHAPGGRGELLSFLRTLEPLAEKMGPFLVQLPAAVSPEHVTWITRLLDHLPRDIGHALEVRHPDFYNHPETFNHYFEAAGCFRVIMDARPIHLHDPSHPEVRAARHEKPDLPVYAATSNGGVMVRLVLHPDGVNNSDYYAFWQAQVATWLQADVTVYMMIHCPNNLYCPSQAEHFHQGLLTRLGESGLQLPPMPAWPVSQPSLF